MHFKIYFSIFLLFFTGCGYSVHQKKFCPYGVRNLLVRDYENRYYLSDKNISKEEIKNIELDCENRANIAGNRYIETNAQHNNNVYLVTQKIFVEAGDLASKVKKRCLKENSLGQIVIPLKKSSECAPNPINSRSFPLIGR